MMISSMSQYNTGLFNYANVSTNSTSNNNAQFSMDGLQGGNRPPGPPPGGGRGPKIDTNEDSSWDQEELEALAEEMSEAGATSFDASEIMSTYDTDADGLISESESQAIVQVDALNMEDMKQVMMSSGRGPQMMGGPSGGQSMESVLDTLIDEDEDGTWGLEELEDFSELLESVGGSSFDSAAMIEKYDTDGDGELSALERAAMREDDAFSLAPLSDSEDETLAGEEIAAKMKVTQALSAYATQTNYATYENLFGQSHMSEVV